MPFRKYMALEVNIVSAKAYEALSKSNELTIADETAHSPKQKNDVDEKERKKRLKGSLIKFGSLAVFAFVVWIFATISWFSQNTSVSGNGMGVSVGANGFELRVSGESEESQGAKIGYSDLYTYIDSSYSENTLLQTAAGHDTIRWRMAGSDDKLKPGAQGELRFEIISSSANIDTLKYSLEIECYSATTVINNTTNEEEVTGLTKILQTDANMTQEKKDGANYLKSHLMFFTDREGNSEADYRYSGLITDITDFTLTPDANDEAVIYWIWPNTFGQIALDSSLEADRNYLSTGAVSVLKHEVCEPSGTDFPNDRDKITDYLKTNGYVFKGNQTYSSLIETLYNKRGVPENYHIEYEKLSGGYNAADLAIGQNIDYVSVLLNATA